MEFLIIWLGTIITSFCVEMANGLRIYKDIADAGYKIDIKRMSELVEQLNSNELKTNALSLLIPVFNIMKVFEKNSLYDNVRPMILDRLNVMGILEEMSEEEIQEYLKRPTGLNALLIPLKSEIRIKDTYSIKINNENSEIFNKTDESYDDINILKVNGDDSRLTSDEQKVFEVIDENDSKEIFENSLEDKTNKDSSITSDNRKKDITIITQELSISDQKQRLEKFKDELLIEQQKMQETHIEKGPILQNKRNND